MSKILVLNGNPKPGSYSAALADAYAEAAGGAGHEVWRLNVAEAGVDLIPPVYGGTGEVEPWVAAIQAQIAWCEHLVLVTPMWWGGPPAALKALFDRVLTPGFAFRYRPDSSLWDALLKGRSARVILTTDTPGWWFRWVLGRPFVRQLRQQVLGFCGFKPVRFTVWGVVRRSSPERRRRWLEQAARLGAAGA